MRLRVVQSFWGSGAVPYLVGPIMEIEAIRLAKNRFRIGTEEQFKCEDPQDQ
jgi:hypothetical protein